MLNEQNSLRYIIEMYNITGSSKNVYLAANRNGG